MQFFTETDTDVSAAQAERGGRLRKQFGSAQFLVLFGPECAEPQRTIPFFAEIARRSLAEREGGNIQI